MATTENLGLPLDTHGLVATKQSLEAGFKRLDELLFNLDLAYSHENTDAETVKEALDAVFGLTIAYTHEETEAETLKDALDDIFTRLAAVEAEGE